MILVFDPANPGELEFGDDGFPIMDRLPATLTRAAGDAAGKRAKSMEELLGDYPELENHKGFYSKRPKLRERLAMQREGEQCDLLDMTEADATEMVVKMLTKVIYVQEGEVLRPVTFDELLDELDTGDEVRETAGRIIGVRTVDGSAISPNA